MAFSSAAVGGLGLRGGRGALLLRFCAEGGAAARWRRRGCALAGARACSSSAASPNSALEQGRTAGNVAPTSASFAEQADPPNGAPALFSDFEMPQGDGREDAAVDALESLFRSVRGGVVVLTGAGVSTASGIPDYRSPKGSYSKGHKPMMHNEFMRSELNRKRYWARSLVGSRAFSRAPPNAAHDALARLQRHRLVERLITQNVDGLHSRAGSSHVIELHGRAGSVRCLSCGLTYERSRYHDALRDRNAAWLRAAASAASAAASAEVRADGDAALEHVDFASFELLPCVRCGRALLKPDVVFFGDGVPPARRQRAEDAVRGARALLVAGSSLHVYSAYNLVRLAAGSHVPIAVLNIGATRVDREQLATLRLSERCDRVLHALGERLCA